MTRVAQRLARAEPIHGILCLRLAHCTERAVEMVADRWLSAFGQSRFVALATFCYVPLLCCME